MAIGGLLRSRGGWIRILEVMIAITILSGVIIFVYTTRVDSVSLNGYVYSYQKEILSGISIDEELRGVILNDDKDAVMDSIVLPINLNFTIKICDLTNPPTPCNMDSDLFILLLEKDVYVSEIIVASNLTKYAPKKVKLFIWEN